MVFVFAISIVVCLILMHTGMKTHMGLVRHYAVHLTPLSWVGQRGYEVTRFMASCITVATNAVKQLYLACHDPGYL